MEAGVTGNSYLIAMFVLVPLLSIPVQHGGYGESLREVFVRYANTDSRYYALVSIMAAFVGVLISIAAVPLTYEVSRASGCNYDEKLLASALSRGFIDLHDMGADVGNDCFGCPADGESIGWRSFLLLSHVRLSPAPLVF